MIREPAPAKINLVLRIGKMAPNGLHEVASLFASIDLADEVELEPAPEDSVECEGVEGPNLALAAVERLRQYAPSLPPLRIRITKRIPVAAGLAGGSADAAAAIRAANSFHEVPFDDDQLREIAAPLGSDVPSQIVPAHSIVTGTGESVARVDLPEMHVVLVPSALGIATADVFRKADQMELPRPSLDAEDLFALAGEPPATIAGRLENDLQPATLRLRPELTGVIQSLLDAGALGAQVSGSGPTVFGLFADEGAAAAAAGQIPGALATMVARR
ncbi:MAG TPA: 4-(cytidine 5'-diphospho)-2-C-methyl-D-erythritol kinase [Thermoleophilaceae bacterium]|nr:4-(cytidine 5'-diphospho)-2-C-methyl-D-erythritol kinase [Thermoleophilaceae bacterium]